MGNKYQKHLNIVTKNGVEWVNFHNSLSVIQQLVDKQTPKKPREVGFDFKKQTPLYDCVVCCEMVDKEHNKEYCGRGHKINWKGVE